MKILYLAHRIPYPPNKGEKIRAFHQIRCLSQHHIIHLVCLVDDPVDLVHVKTLKEYCVSVEAVFRSKAAAMFLAARGLLTRYPLSVVAFQRKALARKISGKLEAEKFDLVFVSSSSMASYVLHESHVPRVIDFIDVDSEKWRLYAEHHSFPLSWIYRLEASRLAAYEEEIAQMFDYSIFISEAERLLFQRRVSNRPIAVISNGVDLEYFTPPHGGFSSSRQPSVVFTGAMDYFPNVDAVRYFCTEIFPLVRQVEPEAQFFIVGRNPTRSVQELGNHDNVIVTGSIPDVRPYLAKATVAVAPFRIARGIQNKILEAMAMRLPVVGTSQAFEGIDATENDGIRIADDPQRFAQEVIIFLKGDDRLRQQWGLQARHYIEEHHRWRDVGVKLECLLHEVVGATTRDTASLVLSDC